MTNRSNDQQVNFGLTRLTVLSALTALIMPTFALSEPLSADLKRTVIERLEIEIVGEHFSIEHLVQTLTNDHAITLLMGPEGVGKASLSRQTLSALNLNPIEIDFRSQSGTFQESLAHLGISLSQGGAQSVILNHIEYLSGEQQNQLADLLNFRKISISLANGSNRKPKRLEVDLSHTRFVLITDEGDGLFRNPVGFHTSWMKDPDTDQFLETLADERMRRALSGWGLTPGLVDSIHQIVPVRRLNASEFKIALNRTLTQFAERLSEGFKKEILIEQQDALADLIFKRIYRLGESTFHQINQAVENLFTEETERLIASPSLRRVKSIALTWTEESLTFIPKKLNCSTLLSSPKPKGPSPESEN